MTERAGSKTAKAAMLKWLPARLATMAPCLTT
jgi:hypothetical protein